MEPGGTIPSANVKADKGLGLNSMVNICERSINVVMFRQAEDATEACIVVRTRWSLRNLAWATRITGEQSGPTLFWYVGGTR